MNEEEQLIHDLAIEHHAKIGHQFKPLYIAPYDIAGSEQGCVYMVCGRMQRTRCSGCMECTHTLVLVLYLRIGRGFTHLDLGHVKPVCGNDTPASVLKKLFGIDG